MGPFFFSVLFLCADSFSSVPRWGSDIMGRRPTRGGIVRMSFSLTHRTASLLRQIRENHYPGKNVSMTHVVSMSIHQWARMKACGAWQCEGALQALHMCGHLNSRLATHCEACGQISPVESYREYRKKSEKELDEKDPGAKQRARDYQAALDKAAQRIKERQ